MINIVHSKRDNWILTRLAMALADGLQDARLVESTDRTKLHEPGVVLNYYVNDWTLNGCVKNPNAKTVCFLDHPKSDKFLLQADEIVTMCPQYQKYAERLSGKPAYMVIQPVDTEHFTPKLRLGFVGRFVGVSDYGERKGRTLLERVQKIPYVDFKATLGELALDAIPEFIRSLDAVIVTATVEGGPMCLTESLACGVPVIIPSTVGVAELFKDGIIDYKAGDFDSLKSALDRLFETKLVRRRLVEQYTWEFWVTQHKRIFDHILKRADTCVYTTCIGEYGRKLGDISIPLMKKWAYRHGFDFCALTEQGDHETPSWVRVELPCRMREGGYARAVYFDLDTIINPDAPNIFDGLPVDGWDIAAWPHDTAIDWDLNAGIKQVSNYCVFAGLPFPKGYNGKNYFNAGVLVVRDRFLNWEPGWAESPNECQDQNALNLAVSRGDLRWHPLGKEWNNGHTPFVFKNIFDNAHVIHCNQPTWAPCSAVDARERLMREVVAQLSKEPIPVKRPVLTRSLIRPRVRTPLERRSTVSRVTPSIIPAFPERIRDSKGKVVLATVAIGTDPLYAKTLPLLASFAERNGYDFVQVNELNGHLNASWARLECGNVMRESGCDTLLYVDADVLIPDWAVSPIPYTPDVGVAAMDSAYWLPYAKTWPSKHAGYARRLGLDIPKNRYINGGVLIVNRAASGFWDAPSKEENDGRSWEQTWLNCQTVRYPFHNLSRLWNWGHLSRQDHLRMAMNDQRIQFVHLVGAQDKSRTAQQILNAWSKIGIPA